MKMPPPIATKFTKLVLTILAITILGIILSFVSQDHTLLMLSAGVAVAGGVKIIDYYRTIKGEHYECIEGTLVREQAGYARKRHMIVLALEDGSLEQRILEGRYKLKIGTDYRFYLKREPIAEIQIELPEILQPAIKIKPVSIKDERIAIHNIIRQAAFLQLPLQHRHGIHRFSPSVPRSSSMKYRGRALTSI